VVGGGATGTHGVIVNPSIFLGAYGGNGGSSFYGQGARGLVTFFGDQSRNGQDANGFGGGGSGACCRNNAPNGAPGGDGSSGIVIIEVFA